MYKFIDHATESGKAVCDTDVLDSNLMNLKYSDKSDFVVEAPNGVLDYNELTITAPAGLKIAKPKGIASDKSLESNVQTLEEAKTLDITSVYNGVTIFLGVNGLEAKYREETDAPGETQSSGNEYYLYNNRTNFYYDNLGNIVDCGRIGVISSNGEVITSLESVEVFRPACNRELKDAKKEIGAELTAAAEEIKINRLISDRLYTGEDLTQKFAKEIAEAGNVYTWLEARKNAGNFEGIHVGDYFPTSISAGTVAGYNIAAQAFRCRIVGINTYKNCGDTSIGNMLYIMSDEVIDTPIKWNPINNNNGTNNRKNPWLASAMYAVLNGVNNYDNTSGYNKAAHGANASAKGILQLLPQALQTVLKQKRNLLDDRYSSSGLLTGSTDWNWGDMGKLWLPNEYEVYGCAVHSNLCQTSGFWHPEAGSSIQFPWFANNCEHRIKKNSTGGRCTWWLSSAASGYTAGVCVVSDSGNAHSYYAYVSIYAPLCFCI